VNDNDSENMWRLPFELVLEVAAFCAGESAMRTHLDLSLCCKEVQTYLKKVLDEPVLFMDDHTALPDTLVQKHWSGGVKRIEHESEGISLVEPRSWTDLR
jgi:hypothetical protein